MSSHLRPGDDESNTLEGAINPPIGEPVRRCPVSTTEQNVDLQRDALTGAVAGRCSPTTWPVPGKGASPELAGPARMPSATARTAAGARWLPSTVVVVGHRVHGPLPPSVTGQRPPSNPLLGSDRAGRTHRHALVSRTVESQRHCTARGAIGPYRARWRAPILRPWPPTSPDPGRHTSR